MTYQMQENNEMVGKFMDFTILIGDNINGVSGKSIQLLSPNTDVGILAMFPINNEDSIPRFKDWAFGDYGICGDYNTSWNKLMNVVEKIETLQVNDYKFRVRIIDKFCAIESYTGETDIEFKNDGRSKIEATYKAIIKFIRWYYSVNKPKSREIS